jgi:hypothetical protein
MHRASTPKSRDRHHHDHVHDAGIA